jgi:hypothetical protein
MTTYKYDPADCKHPKDRISDAVCDDCGEHITFTETVAFVSQHVSNGTSAFKIIIQNSTFHFYFEPTEQLWTTPAVEHLRIREEFPPRFIVQHFDAVAKVWNALAQPVPSKNLTSAGLILLSEHYR